MVVCRLAGARRDRREEQRPAGDGLAMQVGIGEANEDVPPVVEQRDEPRREPATGEIVRRRAAPAPLVLHLVEDVFPVASVAIELTERFVVSSSEVTRTEYS